MLVFACWVVAIADSRPCVVRRPSMVAGYFLLLAQKKVTKENGTLGFAPSAAPRVRYGRTGFAHRPSMACCRNRRDPSRRPRAVHAAFRPPFAAAPRGPESKSGSTAYMRHRIYTTGRFCGRDCRALLFPGPSRPRRAGGGKSPKGRAQDARASDLGTGTCRERTPEPARGVTRAWMPA